MMPTRCERCGKTAEPELCLSDFRYVCSACLVDGVCVDCRAGIKRCGCQTGCARCGLSGRGLQSLPQVEAS